MEQFIGTKQIKARPMNRQEYNDYRGWELPANEKGEDEGYLVEYPESPNKNDERHADYISWLPKEEFEKVYRKTDGLTFGLAIEAAKQGRLIARAGWNGKGMYVALMPGYPDGIEVNEATQKAHGLPSGTKLVYRPYFQLFTAQKDVAMWSPSGSDALAEDWVIIQ